MKKWCVEDWEFELTVINGKAAHCRLGLETGDKFVFSYECPAGICPRVMMEMYTWCEVIRCGGDFTYRGERKKYEMVRPCPCGCIKFHLKAAPINRDENGKKKHLMILPFLTGKNFFPIELIFHDVHLCYASPKDT